VNQMREGNKLETENGVKIPVRLPEFVRKNF
jgi:hypothetical protein